MKKELFDEDLFNKIKENEIIFPLYFKNKYGTCYVTYYNEEKFEEITISKNHESFRGSVLFGFNEELHRLKGDIKTWFYIISRNKTKIEKEEYDKIFESVIQGRQEFFSGNSFEYIDIETNPDIKITHKWKPIES